MAKGKNSKKETKKPKQEKAKVSATAGSTGGNPEIEIAGKKLTIWFYYLNGVDAKGRLTTPYALRNQTVTWLRLRGRPWPRHNSIY